jgi:hypothetical protein
MSRQAVLEQTVPPPPANVPAFPIESIYEGGTDEISPLAYAQPVQTDWAAPNTVGPAGPFIDDYFGTISNPNIPGPWNRNGAQQNPGVSYNHNDFDTVMLSGTGSMEFITEPTENMGGLVTLFPDARYMSRPFYDGTSPDQSQGEIWREGIPGIISDQTALTQFILPEF